MKRFAIALAVAASACFTVLALAPPAHSQPAPELTLGAQTTPTISDEQLATFQRAEDQNYATFVSQPYPVTVVQPDAVDEAASKLPALIAAAVFAVMLRFAGPFAWMLKVARADQMIERYAKGIIDEWLDHNPKWRTEGITIDVKTAWAQAIATNVINYAPGWLIQFLGGKEAIMQKVRNRLPDILKDAFPAVFEAHRGAST